MNQLALSDQEFRQFQTMIYDIAGISMSPAKKPLVSGRLAKRVKQHGLNSYGDYFRILMQKDKRDELQVAIDLLTTNETYFFREPKHFDFMRQHVPALRRPGKPFRIWSAASSSGEEPYTIAMVLADVLGDDAWEVIGSDISSRVLEKARGGHYPMTRIEGIPRHYLSRFCLKGTGPQEGTFLVDRNLRNRVSFQQVNLNENLPKLGEFDMIFLRNVMIYFDMETKQQVVARMLPLLRPGGYFVVSHSESLNGITDALKIVSPSIYRKPDA
ncbi:CheR family methyltransferase [Ferrigenium kumadai]|uniref:CheR family methyltransferase n=1 Tax=Ferrigenium kumadai TaxID=1682490 RepID=UPI001FE2D63B|nr:protein-glutamate O-methyltransferase CheR [Ferrigenium kumadai]